jgi:uncharacterized repeat protein (TIGR01451 family)
MTEKTMGRAVPLWAIALFGGALVATAVLVFLGGAAQAQTAQGVDLVVDKTIRPRSVQVGERQTFTITVTNEGTRRARAVRMRDPLPRAVKFLRASTSRQVPGSCGIDEFRTVVCRLGALGPDRTVTVKIFVRTRDTGRYTNRAYVSYRNSDALELDFSDNRDGARARVTRG